MLVQPLKNMLAFGNKWVSLQGLLTRDELKKLRLDIMEEKGI